LLHVVVPVAPTPFVAGLLFIYKLFQAQLIKVSGSFTNVGYWSQNVSQSTDLGQGGAQPFSDHVPLQHFDRRASTPKTIDVFNIKLIMIFENNIHWYMYKYMEINNIQIFYPSIANLKCTHSDRQMYP